ncbi:FadR/GntR family transcriptional regulator [Microbacterium aurantiacum]|uniref:FadR/GntR family transcriptional regulator n=1 Tax=Microbacterium aurantiacum TaxID=162393 RepID=UPI003422C67D
MDPVVVPPAPPRAESVPVNLAAHLERLIVTGQLKAGSRLPSERALAATLSVSRSTLREAMYELEAKGLVERTRGRGTIVLDTDLRAQFGSLISARSSQQSHAAELRVTIEPPIAALAAQRATRANLVQLRDALDRSHEGLTPSESLRLDIEFHQLVAHAARNPLLSTLQELAAEWVAGVRQQSHTTVESRRSSRDGHEAIYAAIAARDPELAKAAMEDHLRVVEHLIATADPEPPPSFGPDVL